MTPQGGPVVDALSASVYGGVAALSPGCSNRARKDCLAGRSKSAAIDSIQRAAVAISGIAPLKMRCQLFLRPSAHDWHLDTEDRCDGRQVMSDRHHRIHPAYP